MAKPVEIEILLKDRVSAGLELMQRKLEELMAKAQGSGERVRILEAAIGALTTQLAAMRKAGEATGNSIDQGKNIEAISALETKIKELQEQLRQLGETAENTSAVPAGAGQATRQYNGLHMSMQQIARELPAATMGLNMFFLAISNNLPILTDEIKRAKAANEELKASGQGTVPVWRQLVGSIFSWQTALMVAITVLSMYGKEIVNWVGGLFKAKDATDEARKSQEEFNAYVRKLDADWRDSVAATAGANISAYKRLAREYSALGDSMDSKKKFIKDNQDAFHNLGFSVDGVTDAENLFVRNTDAVVNALVARAKAAAYEQEITDATQRYIKQTEYNNSTVAGGGYYNRIRAGKNWATTGTVPEELRGLEEGVDYTLKSSQTVASFTLTAAGAAKINAQRSKEAADRLKRNNDEAKRQLDSVVNRATEGIKRQADAEQAVYDSLDLKTYDPADAEVDKDGKKAAEKHRKAQEELGKDMLALRQKNQDDEIALMREGMAKKLAEIDNDYEKRIAEIGRQEAEFRKRNKEAGTKGLGQDGLTDSQSAALQKARDLAAKEQESRTQEVYAAEVSAMRDYLKEYGTFQQQKLAIAQEYADKISKAQTEGERMRLTAERDRAVQQVEINAVRQQVDWGSVFGEFGTMFRDQLQPTIDRLRQIAGSDTFRQSSLEDQQLLYSLIERLESSNTVWDGDIFKKVSDDLSAYQDAMRRYAAAVDAARTAANNLAAAEKALEAARRGNSGKDEIAAAQAGVDAAREAFDAASADVRAFGGQVQETTAALNSSATEARAMFENLAEGLRGLSSGSLQGIGQGLMKLDGLFGDNKLTAQAGNALAKGFQSLLGKDSQAAKTLSEALGSSGLAGEIISAILGVLDMLAEEGIGGIVSNLMDTVLGSVNGILDDIFSGGIITKPMQSLVDGVGGILDTITFGGLGSWLGGNDKEVMETVNRLTESNEYLRESIEGLAERIGEGGATNAESVDYYNQAREAELEWEANQREKIRSIASAWTNSGYGFLGLGGKGSFNKHSPGSGWYGWDEFTETLRNNGIDITVDSTGDLWGLTPEEMELLRDSNPKAWQELFSGDGHKNPKDAVNEYIERAGTLEELTDALNEKLTGYTWDGFRDSYKELIKNMEGDTEDFADFINEAVSNALIESFVNEELQDGIKELYEYIADAAADGLTEDEIEAIRKMNEAIAEEAAAWRGDMEEAGLIEPNGTAQTGKAGAYTAMSQEQGTKLEGLWTTSAMHLSSMDGTLTDVSAQMGAAADCLRQIEANTGDSAKHLGEIKEDIKKIVRDGLKVK